MVGSKVCFKCKEDKPLSEFYKHKGMSDGCLNKCKCCTRRDVLEHRSKNLDKIRAYDRERAKNKERRKLAAEVGRRWREQDSRRVVAHSAVARAIRKGRLVKRPCERCLSEKSVAHHDDYDKPLSVTWLCTPCHKQRHKEIAATIKSL